MVCTIADYKHKGINKHQAFQIHGTDNFSFATEALLTHLHQQEYAVQQITVIMEDLTLEELELIAETGPQKGLVYIVNQYLEKEKE